jgi:hypothetical protein
VNWNRITVRFRKKFGKDNPEGEVQTHSDPLLLDAGLDKPAIIE